MRPSASSGKKRIPLHCRFRRLQRFDWLSISLLHGAAALDAATRGARGEADSRIEFHTTVWNQPYVIDGHASSAWATLRPLDWSVAIGGVMALLYDGRVHINKTKFTRLFLRIFLAHAVYAQLALLRLISRYADMLNFRYEPEFLTLFRRGLESYAPAPMLNTRASDTSADFSPSDLA